jgi:hypothetical protein
MQPPFHPRKGTIMVGAVSGYYEPEWDEECAWRALSQHVYAHFTDWSGEDRPKMLRKFACPGDVLRAAKEIVAERAAAEIARAQRRAQPASGEQP